MIPVAASLVFGPLLAYALGRCLLSSHPEQAVALLLLALLPGSAFAPVWARSARGSGSLAMTLTLTGWALAAPILIPLVALILELVVGAAAFGLHALGAEARSSATPGAQDGSPSIVPE